MWREEEDEVALSVCLAHRMLASLASDEISSFSTQMNNVNNKNKHKEYFELGLVQH